LSLSRALATRADDDARRSRAGAIARARIAAYARAGAANGIAGAASALDYGVGARAV
jgi:hypothetical protein